MTPKAQSTVTHVAGLICYPCPRPPSRRTIGSMARSLPVMCSREVASSRPRRESRQCGVRTYPARSVPKPFETTDQQRAAAVRSATGWAVQFAPKCCELCSRTYPWALLAPELARCPRFQQRNGVLALPFSGRLTPCAALGSPPRVSLPAVRQFCRPSLQIGSSIYIAIQFTPTNRATSKVLRKPSSRGRNAISGASPR
jgi:hypothetical protein